MTEERDSPATAPLMERLTLQQVSGEVFLGNAPDRPPRIYGGELAAQTLAAANETVPEDRVAHTLQCTYLAPGDPCHPLRLAVTRVRDGRSFSTRVVQVSNNDRLIMSAQVGYHVPEAGLNHQIAMPDVPLPEDLPTIGEVHGHAWTRWAEADRDIEMRVVPTDLDDPIGRRMFWCKVVEKAADDLRLHTALAAYLSDFTMVASVRLPHEPQSAKQHLMSTLNHSLYFHRAVRADDWLLIDHCSPVAACGRGLALAAIYTRFGELAITAVQEGLIRPLPPGHL